MNQLIFTLWLAAVAGNLISCSSLSSEKPYHYNGSKLRGVAFVAPRASLADTTYLPVKQVNAEWVALMPYGFTAVSYTHLAVYKRQIFSCNSTIWIA